MREQRPGNFLEDRIARRNLLKAGALAAAGLILPAGCASLAPSLPPKTKHPNILLITTDDQGIQAGCFGDRQARTPNMDRLAAEGVRFSQAYVTQSSCSPSRSSMFTGLYPHQNGHIGLASHEGYAIKEGIKTLPAVLKEAGYRTGVIGKIHVNPKDALPFDYSSMTAWQTRDVAMVAQNAGEFFAASDQPFFLMVNFMDPHRPYDGLQVEGLPEHPRTGAEIEPLRFVCADDAAIREDTARYYNMVERADAGLGMLLDALQKAGLAENTLVIILGDNGPPYTRAKTTCYEAGLRTPLIIRWPGHAKAGHVCHDLVSSVDLMPTILEAAGIGAPAGLAGNSLASLLAGRKDAAWRKTLCAEYTCHGPAHYFPRRSIRDDRYKLILNLLQDRPNPVLGLAEFKMPKTQEGTLAHEVYATFVRPPRVELYDLSEDPDEFHNLAGKPEFAEIEARLLKQLENWQNETSDPLLDPASLARITREHDELGEALRKQNKQKKEKK